MIDDTRIYVRASTKDQDAERALYDLKNFALSIEVDVKEYVEMNRAQSLIDLF
jgi:DNA invertase Pin-like site-specific DNA recombinase